MTLQYSTPVGCLVGVLVVGLVLPSSVALAKKATAKPTANNGDDTVGSGVTSKTSKAVDKSAVKTIGILRIETYGVSGETAQTLEDAIIGEMHGLDEPSFRIENRETVKKKLLVSDYLDGCVMGPCLQAIRDKTGIELIMVGSIGRVGTSYSFVLSLIDTKTGRITSQSAERCDVCTLDEAVSTATMSVISVVNGMSFVDPELGVSGAGKLVDKSKLTARIFRIRRRSKVASLVVAGVGAVALSAGIIALSTKNDSRFGAGMATAGLALTTTGLTLFGISRKF